MSDDWLRAFCIFIFRIGLSTPNTDTAQSTFGHMLSMLFQWFNATAYLPNDKTGTALEKLKSEYLPPWLQKVQL